jgi:TonB family protein
MKTLALASFLPLLLAAQEPPNPAPNAAADAAKTAPALDPALAADIRKLLDEAGMMQLVRQQIDAASQPMVQLMKQNPSLTPQFVDELMRRVKEKLLGPELEEMAVQIYARFFTREDVRQLLAYQESPIGRKSREVMPQMLAELNKEMREYGENVGRDAAIELVKEHPEYLKPTGASATAPVPPAGDASGADSASAAQRPTPFTGDHIEKQAAEANLIKKIDPLYPDLAKKARVQGAVRFSVLISKEGKVEDMRLISGHPLLVNAAKDAVKQWEYKPFLLDNRPVQAITEVEVDFYLHQ